jgi:CBS domain-containing protein
MKVKEVMTPHAKAIWLTESLADAALMMWETDCGVLPIIKDGQKVIGMITDRDICMASAMRNTTPSAISVEEVMTGEVYGVQADDTVEQALEMMKEHRVRRLPVLNEEGELEGILSMNDIVLNAKQPDDDAEDLINYEAVVRTYQTICHRPKDLKATSAAV